MNEEVMKKLEIEKKENITADLSRFSEHELAEAGLLLIKLSASGMRVQKGSHLTLYVNKYYGNVFLIDNDLNIYWLDKDMELKVRNLKF